MFQPPIMTNRSASFILMLRKVFKTIITHPFTAPAQPYHLHLTTQLCYCRIRVSAAFYLYLSTHNFTIGSFNKLINSRNSRSLLYVTAIHHAKLLCFVCNKIGRRTSKNKINFHSFSFFFFFFSFFFLFSFCFFFVRPPL